MEITASDLNHQFAFNGSKLEVLKDIDIFIEEGEFTALIGPSGCGKSTMLRILSGLLEPTAGKVTLGGNHPSKALSSKRIGWLAQNPALLPWKTVSENIVLAQEINPQINRNEISVGELIEMVDLADFSNAYPFTLSGGMQQRAALARTLALGASIWLMDEPFAALDELTRESLIEELIPIWEKFRPTVLWITHHIYEAVHIADRVLVMSSRPGNIIADISIPMSRPRDESSEEFQDIVTNLKVNLKKS